MKSPRKSPTKKKTNRWLVFLAKWRKSHSKVTVDVMKKAKVDYWKTHKKSPKKKSPKKKSASRRK